MGVSADQAKAIASSWTDFKGGASNEDIGKAFFLKLFEMFPDNLEQFPKFKGKSAAELNTDILKDHGGKVVGKIEEMVGTLGDAGKWNAHKVHHGKFHKGINIGGEYMDNAGKVLCALMAAKLGGNFKAEAAWVAYMGELRDAIKNA